MKLIKTLVALILFFGVFAFILYFAKQKGKQNHKRLQGIENAKIEAAKQDSIQKANEILLEDSDTFIQENPTNSALNEELTKISKENSQELNQDKIKESIDDETNNFSESDDNIESIQQNSEITSGNYVIIVGTFSFQENAINLVQKLKGKNYTARWIALKTSEYFVVKVGPYDEKNVAKQDLENINLEFNIKGYIQEKR